MEGRSGLGEGWSGPGRHEVLRAGARVFGSCWAITQCLNVIGGLSSTLSPFLESAQTSVD